MPISQILWGANFENVLSIGYSLFDIVTDFEPREGTEWVQSPGGAEDAWWTGGDYTLAGIVKWIPDVPGTNPVQSPVSGSVGWQAFLTWARQKNALRFVPDQTNPLF